MTLDLSNAISFSKSKHHERLELVLMIPKPIQKPTSQF